MRCIICDQLMETENHRCPKTAVDRLDREHQREARREPYPVEEDQDFDSRLEVSHLMNMEMGDDG